MIALAAALLLLTQTQTGPADSSPDSSVIVTFETGASTGSVMVALYNSEASYGSGAPVAAMAVPADGPVVARFDHLPAGDYAVKSFHDLNGDGEMTTNPFGIPIEPYAFSNNAVGNMGPARWAAARFPVSGETAQTISLR